MHKRAHGFVLIELVFVVVIIAVLLFIVVSQTVQSGNRPNDAQRRADVNSILNALNDFAKDNGGKYPEGVTDHAKLIASTNGAINLCDTLVPAYLNTIPIDPGSGLSVPPGAKCNDKNARYSSGYTVQITSGNKILVSAPDAEGDGAVFATN